jgi:hypothetical protein
MMLWSGGAVAQDLGVMEAGKRYRVVADVKGSVDGVVTASLESSLSGGTIYTQADSAFTSPVTGFNRAILSYDATSADAGKHLWVKYAAKGSFSYQTGIDNVRLTVTPFNLPMTGTLTLSNSTSATRGITAAREGDVLSVSNTLTDGNGMGTLYYTWTNQYGFFRSLSPTYTLGPDALAQLAEHTWPGNVRELENVLRRGLALAHASGAAEIGACHLLLGRPGAVRGRACCPSQTALW